MESQGVSKSLIWWKPITQDLWNFNRQSNILLYFLVVSNWSKWLSYFFIFFFDRSWNAWIRWFANWWFL